MKDNYGKYLLIVDGSIPMGNPGFSTIAGISNYDMLMETAEGAAAIVAVGTCASFGASPRPSRIRPAQFQWATSSRQTHHQCPGCPPIPVVMTVCWRTSSLSAASPNWTPRGAEIFLRETIHDRCYRRPFYDQGKFARASTMRPHDRAGAFSSSAARDR